MGKLGYNSSNKIGPSFSTYSGLRDSGVLLPADIPNIDQWLVDYDSGFEYVDKADAPQLAKPINVGVPVLAFDGTTNQYLLDSDIVGDETVISQVGTSTPSFSAGRIDFTAGYMSFLELSNNIKYSMQSTTGPNAYRVDSKSIVDFSATLDFSNTINFFI